MLQAFYEQIRAYFSRPGAVIARNLLGSCVYRTPAGEKCAVGCLIPDALYNEGMEGHDLMELTGQFPDLDQLLFGAKANTDEDASAREWFSEEEAYRRFEFLRQAQSLHDTWADDAAHFVQLLDVRAQNFGLNVVVDEPQVIEEPQVAEHELVLA